MCVTITAAAVRKRHRSGTVIVGKQRTRTVAASQNKGTIYDRNRNLLHLRECQHTRTAQRATAIWHIPVLFSDDDAQTYFIAKRVTRSSSERDGVATRVTSDVRLD